MHAHSTGCDEKLFFNIAASIVDINRDELPDPDAEDEIVKRSLTVLKPMTEEDDECISQF